MMKKANSYSYGNWTQQCKNLAPYWQYAASQVSSLFAILSKHMTWVASQLSIDLTMISGETQRNKRPHDGQTGWVNQHHV